MVMLIGTMLLVGKSVYTQKGTIVVFNFIMTYSNNQVRQNKMKYPLVTSTTEVRGSLFFVSNHSIVQEETFLNLFYFYSLIISKLIEELLERNFNAKNFFEPYL